MQVMLNLLKNAAEATPPVGGLIMLRTAYRAGVKVRTARGTESLPLQVTISDNGSGVPEELKPHIFEPFVTSKAKGSGLGLALVSKVIADHGGVISCEFDAGVHDVPDAAAGGERRGPRRRSAGADDQGEQAA